LRVENVSTEVVSSIELSLDDDESSEAGDSSESSLDDEESSEAGDSSGVSIKGVLMLAIVYFVTFFRVGNE